MAQQRPFKGENDPQIFTEVRTFFTSAKLGRWNPNGTFKPGRGPSGSCGSSEIS